MPGAAMPVWFEADFAGTRDITRFVVITYQGPGSATAGRYGLLNYRIQIWNDAAHLRRQVDGGSGELRLEDRLYRKVLGASEFGGQSGCGAVHQPAALGQRGRHRWQHLGHGAQAGLYHLPHDEVRGRIRLAGR